MNIRKLLFICFALFPFLLIGQFQNFADSYSMLSTIAGKGSIDDKGVNGWQVEFEEGNAIDAELSRPHFAMADTAGNIYIADKDAHAIRKVTTDGKIFTIAGTNVAGDNGDGVGTECQLNAPNGLWVRKDGTVYILDLGNDKIRRLNLDGSLETIVDDEAGYSLGRGLWVTQNDDSIFYANGSSIKLWTATSGVETYASGFNGLGNLTQDKNGFLVASDRSANRVYRISKDGTSKETIAGNGLSTGGGSGLLATETALHGVRGVWFLNDNSYFVACHEGSQVWYIDVTGKIHLFLDGSEGDSNYSGDGENYRTPGYKISEARSISVDYDGNVIITENDRGFIRKIKNDYTYYYTSNINKKSSFEEVKAYPNPASSEFNVEYYSNKNIKVLFTLVNCIGKVVLQTETISESIGINYFEINTTDISNGVYLYAVIIDGENTTGKLIINK